MSAQLHNSVLKFRKICASKLIGLIPLLRSLSANPGLENNRSHMFNVGRRNIVSQHFFMSLQSIHLCRFRARDANDSPSACTSSSSCSPISNVETDFFYSLDNAEELFLCSFTTALSNTGSFTILANDDSLLEVSGYLRITASINARVSLTIVLLSCNASFTDSSSYKPCKRESNLGFSDGVSSIVAISSYCKVGK